MHKDMSGTDFHLVCEGSPLPAHRLVLAAASPYFKAMLITDTAEAKAGRTNLECSEELGRNLHQVPVHQRDQRRRTGREH